MRGIGSMQNPESAVRTVRVYASRDWSTEDNEPVIVDGPPEGSEDAHYFRCQVAGNIYRAGDIIPDPVTGQPEHLTLGELRAMLPDILRNGEVLLDHKNQHGPVGKIIAAHVTSDGILHATIETLPPSTCGRAADIRAGIRNGHIRCFSIGWDIKYPQRTKRFVEISLCKKGFFPIARMKGVIQASQDDDTRDGFVSDGFTRMIWGVTNGQSNPFARYEAAISSLRATHSMATVTDTHTGMTTNMATTAATGAVAANTNLSSGGNNAGANNGLAGISAITATGGHPDALWPATGVARVANAGLLGGVAGNQAAGAAWATAPGLVTAETILQEAQDQCRALRASNDALTAKNRAFEEEKARAQEESNKRQQAAIAKICAQADESSIPHAVQAYIIHEEALENSGVVSMQATSAEHAEKRAAAGKAFYTDFKKTTIEDQNNFPLYKFANFLAGKVTAATQENNMLRQQINTNSRAYAMTRGGAAGDTGMSGAGAGSDMIGRKRKAEDDEDLGTGARSVQASKMARMDTGTPFGKPIPMDSGMPRWGMSSITASADMSADSYVSPAEMYLAQSKSANNACNGMLNPQLQFSYSSMA